MVKKCCCIMSTVAQTRHHNEGGTSTKNPPHNFASNLPPHSAQPSQLGVPKPSSQRPPGDCSAIENSSCVGTTIAFVRDRLKCISPPSPSLVQFRGIHVDARRLQAIGDQRPEELVALFHTCGAAKGIKVPVEFHEVRPDVLSHPLHVYPSRKDVERSGVPLSMEDPCATSECGNRDVHVYTSTNQQHHKSTELHVCTFIHISVNTPFADFRHQNQS